MGREAIRAASMLTSDSRFDALHLIASPPRYADETNSEWSSAEDDDAFFLSGDELVMHEQAKRREQLASLRTERIRTKTIKEPAAPLVHPQPAAATPEEVGTGYDIADESHRPPSSS